MPTRSIAASVLTIPRCSSSPCPSRRETALGQPSDAVILDDIDHVDAAPHRVGELAEGRSEALSPSPETPR